MCSVLGIITKKNSNNFIDHIKTMMFNSKHRGPDENNLLIAQNVLLGNTRLSIVDPNTTDTQPASFNNIHVVFNGEIYNFHNLKQEIINEYGVNFKSKCDTEVIPYLYYYYGNKFVEKLDGQFSILLYDKNKEKLYAYRDRLGKKPLYYLKDKDTIYFASEQKAIRSVKECPVSFNEIVNVVSLWSYNNSFFEDIFSVEEGSYLEIDINSLHISQYRYFNLSTLMLSKNIEVFDKEEAKNIIYNSLTTAIKKRLHTDVGCGLYLSGGVDSTILASILTKEKPKLKTYSVVFPNSNSFDEQSFQKEVINYYGVDNYSVEITNDILYEEFENYVLHSDSILFRTAPIPMSILAKLASKEEKVIFSGEGSDELFFGYDLFKEVKYSKLVLSKKQSIKDHYIKELYPYMLNDKQLKYMQMILLNNTDDTYSTHKLRTKNFIQFNKFLNNKTNPTLLKKYTYPLSLISDNLKKAQFLEYKTLLQNYLLSVQGDLASMKYSIELRAPFLDQNLIENVMKIDPKILFPLFKEKKLLKETFQQDIPQKIFYRYKQPYRAPDASIFYNKKEIYEKINNYSNFGNYNKDKILSLTNKIIQGDSVTYVESFYFLIIFSSLILMNRTYDKNKDIKINNLIFI